MLLKKCEVSVIPADEILDNHGLAPVHDKGKLSCIQKILRSNKAAHHFKKKKKPNKSKLSPLECDSFKNLLKKEGLLAGSLVTTHSNLSFATWRTGRKPSFPPRKGGKSTSLPIVFILPRHTEKFSRGCKPPSTAHVFQPGSFKQPFPGCRDPVLHRYQL